MPYFLLYWIKREDEEISLQKIFQFLFSSSLYIEYNEMMKRFPCKGFSSFFFCFCFLSASIHATRNCVILTYTAKKEGSLSLNFSLSFTKKVISWSFLTKNNKSSQFRIYALCWWTLRNETFLLLKRHFIWFSVRVTDQLEHIVRMEAEETDSVHYRTMTEGAKEIFDTNIQA